MQYYYCQYFLSRVKPGLEFQVCYVFATDAHVFANQQKLGALNNIFIAQYVDVDVLLE